MPYDTLADLPDAVKKLPKHGQEIYRSAFNSAFKLYDGDEGKAAGTAWAAVKTQYEQDAEGNWTAKESKEAKMETKLSDKNKSKLLQAALFSEYKIGQSTPIPKNLIIDEVYDDRVVYDVDGQLYEASYKLDEKGKAIFRDPKKVQSTKVYRAMEALSMENRRTSLNAALRVHLNLGDDDYAYVEDMTETEVVYSRDQQSYKAPYTIAADNTVTIGDSEKVMRQVTYQSMEALQAKYSELVQEVGKRNASMDASRVKKILELCQELLSSEAEPAVKKTAEALKEATVVLKIVKEQAVVKREDGNCFPAAAYAYVPDADKSSTWQLRLWENVDKKVTRVQLNKSAAALSPGGYKGQKASILESDLPAVKRLIRSEYRRLGVDDEDTSPWVKEAETREEIINFVPLTEAKIDKGRATVIVIKPGFNATEDRYYPAEMLKRDYGIFEGIKMYADHPTEQEDKDRPERSITDWVATLKDVTVDEAGVVSGIAEIIEPWMMQKLAALREKDMLSEMGISINAVGFASKATIDGKETLSIEKLDAARSVDFVTEPGAGGVVTLYEAGRGRDVDLIDLSTLQEKRPDLVKVIEANVRAKITEEVKTVMESAERIKELEGQIGTLTTERDDLKEAAEKAVKEKAIAEAQATIKEAVDKAELPGAAKERLIERFKDSESADGITEAIQAEADYIAKLSESVKIKGLGPSANTDNSEADKKALRESYKRANPDWTDEQLDAAVEGR